MHVYKPCSSPTSPSHHLCKIASSYLADPTVKYCWLSPLLQLYKPWFWFYCWHCLSIYAEPYRPSLHSSKAYLMLSQGFIKSLYLLSTRITRINRHTAMLKGLDPSDYQSTAGYNIFLGSKPITWIVKKQATVSQSTTEGKYRSLASCTAELSGLCMSLFRSLSSYCPSYLEW